MDEPRMNPYRHLSREQLEARLKIAEDVCVLVGWVPPHKGERGEALLQLWMTWSMMTDVGVGPVDHPELDAMIPQLAADRRRRRAEVLARLGPQ